MSSELYEFKLKLLDTGYFKQKRGNEYACTCPFCNKIDHCYVLFDLSNETPLLYNCFRCNEKGILNQSFLDYFDLHDLRIPKMKGIRRIESNDSISTNGVVQSFDPNQSNVIDECSRYIEYRVGIKPTIDELMQFQLVTNPRQYALEYLNRNLKDSYYNQRIWFRLSNGNIHGRNMYRDDIRWGKFETDRVKSVGIYTIRKAFDIESNITVCICEGIMDAIGLYYYNKEHDVSGNYIYFACLGKNYESGVKRLITTGLFGETVSIRIYKDGDVNPRSIKINPLYKKLFKVISIYENTLNHDYGIPVNMIDAKRLINI